LDNSLISGKAIRAVHENDLAYCKFLTANDTGDTGTHQEGIYIAKNAIKILFNEAGIRGENKEELVKIKWQDDFETDSRFVYYGKGTRNEYRITRFGRGFPFLQTERTGDLFVLVKHGETDYLAYVLSTEDEINEFLDAFGMSPTDTNKIIEKNGLLPELKVDMAIGKFLSDLIVDFPDSYQMSQAARDIHLQVFNHKERIVIDPDKQIVSWTEMEYRIFRSLEQLRYGDKIIRGFDSLEHFLETANMVLNRRKSRAGKSLEHHLSAIFTGNEMRFAYQPNTEGKKRPDFIFPDQRSYHDDAFPANKLVFLGAKTTCKDRWRQVINEANRIPVKHLFTLQQGISAQQIQEMEEEGVTLVVPAPFITAYPIEKRRGIWTLKKFVEYTKEITRS